MYHTASLAHDDVIDVADVRRGKISLNRKFGQKSSIFAGNYTVAIANKILRQMEDDEVHFNICSSLSKKVPYECNLAFFCISNNELLF